MSNEIVRIEVKGLKEIQERMKSFPQKWRSTVWITLKTALLVIWQNVPPYPSPPPDSTYRRTGTLGRTLGSGERGGIQSGRPDVFERKLGDRFMSAEFGTRLSYAPFVIGEQQAEIHQGRWWTMAELAKRATKPVMDVFEAMMRGLARWLEGQG